MRADDARRIRVGLAVRRAREAAGLSQSDVARRLRVPPHNVCDLEAGRRGASLGRLEQLAEILGVDLAALVA